MTAGPPPVSPLIALLTAARVWDAELTDALKPIGLTTRKYGLLGHIRGRPGISFSELARRSRITVQSAHTAVATLVAAGLVEDSTAHAGAASTLRVTTSGEAVLARAAEAVAALDARLSAALPGVAEALCEAVRRDLGGSSSE
ncbi:helix-turn-helix domain-containing protein [Polymorphospora rubra]|uniref:MarR family winged helix-turn-helix transcriptional regulator n=1 Tax=Polymorphospora rubra TaxID=338584 RepID=UPI0031CF6804